MQYVSLGRVQLPVDRDALENPYQLLSLTE
jgi:hypothetical protein